MSTAWKTVQRPACVQHAHLWACACAREEKTNELAGQDNRLMHRYFRHRTLLTDALLRVVLRQAAAEDTRPSDRRGVCMSLGAMLADQELPFWVNYVGQGFADLEADAKEDEASDSE